MNHRRRSNAQFELLLTFFSLPQYNPSAGSDSDVGKRRSSRAPVRGSRASARNVRKRKYSEDESEESASDDDFSEVRITSTENVH